MSVFLVKAEEFDAGKLKFGKVETPEKAKYPRIAIGYEGMPKQHITTLPKGKAKRRNPKQCLHILVRGDYDATTHRYNGLYSLGVKPTYVYEQDRIEENINGYQLQICLVGKDNVDDRSPEDERLMSVFESLQEQIKDWIVENRDELDLPRTYKTFSDDELRDMVQPLHVPKKEKEGKTYGETLFSRIGYWKENLQYGYPERFTVPFKGPAGEDLNPKDLIDTHGRVIFAFRLNHLTLLSGPKDKNFKIKVDAELADVVFNPVSRESTESNLCGGAGNYFNEDMRAQNEGYGGTDTTEYGDKAAETYEGDQEEDDQKDDQKDDQEEEDEEETSEERRRRKKREKKERKRREREAAEASD